MPKKKEEDDASSVSDVVTDEEPAEETEEESNDLTKAEVVTKYRCAGDIANKVLQAVIEAIKPGVMPVEICTLGDTLVEEACSKIYNQKKGGKKMDKGSAFPTCISVNNCVGHYSPLVSEELQPPVQHLANPARREHPRTAGRQRTRLLGARAC